MLVLTRRVRRAISIAAFCVACYSSTSLAGAEDGVRTLIPLPGGKKVLVWKDKAAHDEALKLIIAGVHKTNPSMIDALLACTPEAGTKAIITDMGFVTHDILVIDGPFSGCRGNLAAEEISR